MIAWRAEATVAATTITQKEMRHACLMSTLRNICPLLEISRRPRLAGQEAAKSELSHALQSPDWRKIVIAIAMEPEQSYGRAAIARDALS